MCRWRGQGTCGLCNVFVDGEEVPACTARLPKRDCTIEFQTPESRRLARQAKRKKKAAPTPKSPFDGLAVPTNPFAAKEAPVEEEQEEEGSGGPTVEDLEQRLLREMGATPKKKKGGWPF